MKKKSPRARKPAKHDHPFVRIIHRREPRKYKTVIFGGENYENVQAEINGWLSVAKVRIHDLKLSAYAVTDGSGQFPQLSHFTKVLILYSDFE